MERDVQTKQYLSVPERFADLINGVVCSGKNIIKPTDLQDMDSYTGTVGKGRKRSKIRYRDLVKKAALGINFMVIGIENQEEVHYLMPLRCMSYDAGEYEKQAAAIREQTRQQSDISGAEFLSGFTKDSRLHPCMTLVLYYGKEWDGAKNLFSILDFTDIPKELQEAVNDYHIRVCEVCKFEDTGVFKTDLKQVFDCIRYSEDKEKLYELITTDPAYRELQEDTYDMIAEYTNTAELMEIGKFKDKGEKVDMCRAITELIQDGRVEGRKEGRVEELIGTSRELGSTWEATLERLVRRLELSTETAEEYMKKYWH